MKTYHLAPAICVILVLGFISSACAAIGPKATATAPATDTPLPKPTNTPRPTATQRPSPTPDVVATQQRKDLVAKVQGYNEKGYIASTKGEYFLLDDFSEDWPQINWFQWWPMGKSAGNFVLDAHFSWSTASETPSESGCGIAFAMQPNGDYFVVFLDKSRILFLSMNASQGNWAREVGKTKGSGRVDFGNPAEADFTLVVQDHYSYVLVDDELIGEYTLLENATIEGQLAYTLLSGTNKDYGTRCEITDARLWKIK